MEKICIHDYRKSWKHLQEAVKLANVEKPKEEEPLIVKIVEAIVKVIVTIVKAIVKFFKNYSGGKSQMLKSLNISNAY